VLAVDIAIDTNCTQTDANLVDHLIPHVPERQWVL